ncbi:MAG: hypothetical protein R3E53_12635 [Myxococcota bacterium]
MLLDEVLLDLLKLRDLLAIEQAHLQEDLSELGIARGPTLGQRALDVRLRQHLQLKGETGHQGDRLALRHRRRVSAGARPALRPGARESVVHPGLG